MIVGEESSLAIQQLTAQNSILAKKIGKEVHWEQPSHTAAHSTEQQSRQQNRYGGSLID